MYRFLTMFSISAGSAVKYYFRRLERLKRLESSADMHET